MRLLTAAILAFIGAAAFAIVHERRRRRERFHRVDLAVAAWNSAPADCRVQIFENRVRNDPDSCADLYLLGAALVRDRRASDAARAFGAAYHLDCDLDSAALMTFACLKAGANADGVASLATLIERTWDEMRRPRLGRRRFEIRLLKALLPPSTDDPRSIELKRFIAAVLNTSTS